MLLFRYILRDYPNDQEMMKMQDMDGKRKKKQGETLFSNLGMKRTDTQFLAIGHRVVPIIEMSHIFKCRLSMHVCALLITY